MTKSKVEREDTFSHGNMQKIQRQESYAQNRQRSSQKLEGDLIITQPTPMYFLTGFLAVIFLLLFLFLMFSNYIKKERVSGYLVPDKGVTKIYSPLNGMISELYISQGDRVKKGDPLFKIQIERNTGENKSISKGLLQALSLQKKNLEKQLKIEKEWYAFEVEKKNATLSACADELLQLKALRVSGLDIYELELEKYNSIKSLHQKGMISTSELNKAKQTLLLEKQKLQEIDLKITQNKTTMDSVMHELGLIKAQFDRASVGILQKKSEIDIQDIRVESETTNIIKAPTNGYISNLNVTLAQHLSANELVLSIIPVDLRLEAHLFVPTKSIGFLKVGQVVRIRYNAFPYQQFGVYSGTIKKISRSVLSPSELERLPTFNEAAYKVTVDLENQNVLAYGSEIKLQPDMTLTADVVLANRSLLEWLLDPVFSLRGGI